MSNRFNNVWDAIEDTEEQAASMRARAELMIALQERIAALKLTQAKAAKLLCVTQPRISDLMRGRIDLFSLETLLDMLSHTGIKVQFRMKKVA
ncbi:MAG TPA: XRE family transcriptional regulator [Pseudomonadales bacterium]|nr:XRE family transcriptional regulator [Pseudomonadales bacterium]